MIESFKERFAHAIAWSAGVKILSQALSIGIGIFLARLLTPEDFGLIAMVLVFTGIAGLLSDVGLGSALIQRQDLNEIHYVSVFWVNFGLGCALALTLYLSSTLMADFYGRHEVEAIIKVLSLSFIIGALALVHRQVLVKSLKFKQLALADFFGMIISGTLALGLAYKGFGFWALVWQQVVHQFTTYSIVTLQSNWKPTFSFQLSALKELFGFSLFVFLTRLLQYGADRLDKLLTGKFLGADSVGILDKSQSMMLFPLQNISHTIGSVMFPALSSLNGDLERVKKVYLKCIEAIAFLTFPMMVGMFSVSEYFVVGVLGSHWSGLIFVFQILCFAGLINSIATVTGSVYLSQGASKLQLKVNLLTRPLVLIFVVIGLSWGVEGVAIGIVLAAWVSGLLTISIMASLIGLELSRIFLVLLPTVLTSIFMGGVLHFMKLTVDYDDYLVGLLVQILVGVFSYITIAVVFRVNAFKLLLSVIRKE